MAYKPPTQTVVDNDTKNYPSNEAVFEALASKQASGNYVTDLTGEVTATGPGSVAATIANSAVTNAKLANMANNTIKGNNSGVAAAPSDLTGTQVTTLLDNFTSLLKGLVPASGGGTTNFLRADGTWAAPGGGMSNPMTTAGDIIVGGVSGTPTRLALGTVDKVLVSNGTTVSYQYAGLGGGAFPANTVIIGQSLPSGMTATSGVLVGTGSNLGTGASQVIIGASSGRSTTGATGANNTVVGAGSFNSASLTSAADNVVIGQGSGIAMTTATANVFIGKDAAKAVTTAGSSPAGNGNVAIGRNAFSVGTTTNSCVFIGDNCAISTVSPYTVAIGALGGRSTSIGQGSVLVGYNAGATANNSVTIGADSTANFTNGTSVGYNSVINAAGGTAIGSGTRAAVNSIALGYGANSAANSFCVGSASAPISLVLLGVGSISDPLPANIQPVEISTVRISSNQTNGSGVNGTLTLSGSNSTGNAAGGDVIIKTCPAGTAGTTINSYIERFRVTAGGDVKVPNYILSPQLYDAGTKVADFTLDLGTNGPCQQVTINAAGPLIMTLSNPVTGGAYLLKIVQGATPGTVTFPATVKWGTAGTPTLSTIAGKIDIINLYYDGTNYFGTYALGF